MKQQSIIQDKSFAFAVRIVKVYRYLCDEKHEFVLSKQLLKCGTSIGANIEESIGGQSRKDFLAKISIAYKEARETMYWLKLLNAAEYLDERQTESLLNNAEELCKMIGSSQVTLKNNS